MRELREIEEREKLMALRDRFAAKAMSSLVAFDLANPTGDFATSDEEWVATYAYKYADAMLAERAKAGAP
jgi:hypothetical protein